LIWKDFIFLWRCQIVVPFWKKRCPVKECPGRFNLGRPFDLATSLQHPINCWESGNNIIHGIFLVTTYFFSLGILARPSWTKVILKKKKKKKVEQKYTSNWNQILELFSPFLQISIWEDHQTPTCMHATIYIETFFSTKYILLMSVYVSAWCIFIYACLPGPFACLPNTPPLHRTRPPTDLSWDEFCPVSS
jgi:hypothetical protein